MSQPTQRNSTRPKKVPRYLQFEEAEYGIYSGGRTNDGREIRSNAQENLQLAKLFTKFVQSANQKMRDYSAQETEPNHSNRHPANSENDRPHENTGRNKEQRAPNPSGQPARKVEEGHADNAKVNSKSIDKKIGINKKPPPNNISATIQSDLNYHAMLGQLIKSNLPDINHLSPESLMKLNLPYNMFELQQASRLMADKDKDKEKKKKEFSAVQTKGAGKQAKQDYKPFKRQSFHLAIAYHIHVKQLNEGNHPSARDIDPTFNARKLREQTGQ